MINAFLRGLFGKAMAHNRRNILSLVERVSTQSVLDLGCDDGAWTAEVAKAAKARKAFGVEIVEARAVLARNRSIEVTVTDMAHVIPLPSHSFDLIHSNQVIEHVPDVDHFAREIFRLLAPGGSAVISTENTSSWHNIFASLFGWQIFSSTNLSATKSGIGNPLALHRGETVELKSWTHKTLFGYRGLIEFFEAHGFTVIEIRGAGYYPLPSSLGAIDPRHAHFITILVKKPAAVH